MDEVSFVNVTAQSEEERAEKTYEILMTYFSSVYHGFDVGEITAEGRVFIKEDRHGTKKI